MTTDRPTGRILDIRARDVLTPEQMVELGRVAGEFGLLEAALTAWGHKLLQLRVPFPRVTGNPGARQHAAILTDLVAAYCADRPDLVEHLRAALSDVEGLANRRNDYLHALWGNVLNAIGVAPGLNDKPNSGMVWKGQGRTMRSFAADAADMARLSDDIARVRHAINRRFGALPAPVGSDIPLNPL